VQAEDAPAADGVPAAAGATVVSTVDVITAGTMIAGKPSRTTTPRRRARTLLLDALMLRIPRGRL